MSAKIVCDFCGEDIQGTPLITSTEKDGQKLDFCSTPCFIDHCKNGEKP